MSGATFDSQEILDFIDLLRIGEVTTYYDLAAAMNRDGRYWELSRFIVKSREIPPCDAARVIHKDRVARKDAESTRYFNVTNNTGFESYYKIRTRAEALSAAGVDWEPAVNQEEIMVASDSVIESQELQDRHNKRLNSR